jgi:hypothetical protein
MKSKPGKRKQSGASQTDKRARVSLPRLLDADEAETMAVIAHIFLLAYWIDNGGELKVAKSSMDKAMQLVHATGWPSPKWGDGGTEGRYATLNFDVPSEYI